MNITITMKDGSAEDVSVSRCGSLANGDLSYRTTDGQKVRVKASEWASFSHTVGA